MFLPVPEFQYNNYTLLLYENNNGATTSEMIREQPAIKPDTGNPAAAPGIADGADPGASTCAATNIAEAMAKTITMFKTAAIAKSRKKLILYIFLFFCELLL